MYFKTKRINRKTYKYVVKSIRLPNGKVKTLEKIYKNESREEIKQIFDKKEKEEHTKYAQQNFTSDHIFTEEEFKKLEGMKIDYRNVLKKLTKTSLKDLLDRFTANFTYESNALEGNSLTLKDVSMVMFENVSLKGKDLREIYETKNSRAVVELITKNKFKVTHEDIIKMHKILMKDIGVLTGYKRFPNEILGKKVKTTPPEKVHQELSSLIKWYHTNEQKLHPLTLAALFHGKFEQIHPFEDGNGRVGRFLINIMLTSKKYPPLIIRKSQRIPYLKALEKFDNGHEDALQRLILKRFKETYRKLFEVYVKYI